MFQNMQMVCDSAAAIIGVNGGDLLILVEQLHFQSLKITQDPGKLVLITAGSNLAFFLYCHLKLELLFSVEKLLCSAPGQERQFC